jgi:hypothetical protein
VNLGSEDDFLKHREKHLRIWEWQHKGIISSTLRTQNEAISGQAVNHSILLLLFIRVM